ncbi:DDE-type integrase/transposase/recombinase [Streptomyces sp. NBS 14/10]|uniref:integrase catalytic domain-containing protein n=1 Tax=Streptomyces sp. NBS 14/10 TaxID=1945643 RepID=UPI000B7CEA2D|nr:DDE-type integrase/transposase/recombinase [Streptomyces sp. NBS 14/10]KAK1184433.1 DDE-type integrase/transposase/recombinase [Streptomyces sp. NBS 14/10]
MAGTRGGRPSESLSIGGRVRWQEREWDVVEWQGPQVTLVPREGGEAPRAVSYRWLVSGEDFAVLDNVGAPAANGAALGRWGWQEGREEEAALWQARMVEIDTGLAPGRSEHEQGFGPETTLAQRCAAMSARLAADGIRCSAHTLADKRRKWKAAGENPVVLLPGQQDKRPGGFTDPRCLAAMQEVVARRAHESDVTIELIREEVEDLLRSRYAAELDDPAAAAALLPSRSTFYLRMKESGLAEVLAGPTRARAALASIPPLPHGGRESVLRPGQVTQTDTTPLRILARGDDGRPTAAEMTSLIDVASHSMCALMITPSHAKDDQSGRVGRATRAIDLTLMLAQAFAPWPVMPGWDPLSAAVASSLPFGALRAADERFTEATAARPVIRPELIIYDQGSPYVSEHFKEVCDRLRIARRPARKRTPTDKPLAENFFITLAHRFSQYVRHGWQGRSHKKRGRGIERMPLYTIAELQQMAQEWVALEYQRTPDAGLRDPFRPGIMLSPNDMYAVQIARSGYRPVPLSPAQNRFFLLQRWVTPGKGGFMIDYRIYQPLAQDAGHYREILLRGGSKLPGQGDQWECRFNPYHPERVWLYDHTAGTWVTCDFRLRHLLTDPWTADMWQEHAERHRAVGGSEEDEEAIALSLAQRDRRRRSRRPPPKRTGTEPPFQGLELETEQPSQDPYAGLEEFDLSTLRPYPAQPISPLAPPPVAAPPTLPAGTGGAELSDNGQAPHPLAALFPDDGDGSPPEASAAGVSAAAYEVVEAELLADPDPDGDDGDEDEDDVWEM